MAQPSQNKMEDDYKGARKNMSEDLDDDDESYVSDCDFTVSDEDEVLSSSEDEEEIVEIDPPPRALVSAQMEYLIASAAVGEAKSEFDQINEQTIAKSRVRSWHIKSRKLYPAHINVYNLLFHDEASMMKECFLVLDTEEWRAYHWIGKGGSRADEAVAAFKAVELAKIILTTIGHRVQCVREVQGNESDEFRTLAADLGPPENGTTFIENEEKAMLLTSSPKNQDCGQHELLESSTRMSTKQAYIHSKAGKSAADIRLYCVVPRKARMQAARLVDVEPKADTLRTLEASHFVLMIEASGSDTLFVWHGVLSLQKERAAALEAALVIRRERAEIHCVEVVAQGEEPPSLWKSLPGGDCFIMACDPTSQQVIIPTNEKIESPAPKMWRSETVTSKVCEKLLEELIFDAIEAFTPIATPLDHSRPRGRPQLPEAPWYRRILQGISTTTDKKSSFSTPINRDPKRRSHFVAAGQGAVSWTRSSESKLYIVRWRHAELDALEATLAENSLKSHACGVLDAGGTVYLWRGRSAGAACLTAAGHVATELLARKPEWCSLRNVDQGSEPAQFRSQFNDWALSEISRAQALAAMSFDRHYQRREESTSTIKPPPTAWRETLKKKDLQKSASRTLPAQQQHVFAAVASMLRQSWGSSSSSSGRNISASGGKRGSMRQRRHSQRWCKREYLCGDPESDDEEAEDDDHLEKRCRAIAPLDETVDHHIVAWRLDNGRLLRVDEAEQGHFCANQSYAVLYGTTVENDDPDVMRNSDSDESACWEDQFDDDGALSTDAALRWKKRSLLSAQRRPDNRFVLIFWQGERAPREHRSRWLLELRPWILEHWAEELRLGMPTEHLRVRQRRESRLFLEIAARAMEGYVVHAGGPPRHCHLFQVRGDKLAFAVEVAPYASSLCSADVFIAAKRGDLDDTGDPARVWESRMTDPSDWTVWVWVGSGSNLRCRRATAGLVLKIMEFLDIDDEATTVSVLDEAGDDGSDARIDFWRALGGPNPYADHPLLRVPPGRRSSVARTPLFFLVVTGSHTAIAREGSHNHEHFAGLKCSLLHKGTNDQHRILHNDRAVVVDAHFQVLVWLGKRAKRRDAALAKRIAFAYAAATRSPPCRVRVLRQNFECSHFKCLFHGWDASLYRLPNNPLSLIDRSTEELSIEATPTAVPYTDPRATYLIRKKTERNLLQQVEKTQETPDSHKHTRQRRASIVHHDSVFTNLLAALLPGEKKTINKKKHMSLPTQQQQNNFDGIQLGRVLDTPGPDSDDSDDDIFQDRLMPIKLDLEGHDGATMDIPEGTNDPILLGADAANRAARRRRKSCSF